MKENLSVEYLKECFIYNPETGELTWRRRPRTHFSSKRGFSTWNARYAEKTAGNIRKFGRTNYYIVCVDYKRYRAHRIAFAMYYGYWPNTEIDHIDGNGEHNFISNLREVSREENKRNSRMYLTNTSGVNGVYWDRANEKWRAQIVISGKVKTLGRFQCIEAATKARKTAEQGMFFTARHGRDAT